MSQYDDNKQWSQGRDNPCVTVWEGSHKLRWGKQYTRVYKTQEALVEKGGLSVDHSDENWNKHQNKARILVHTKSLKNYDTNDNVAMMAVHRAESSQRWTSLQSNAVSHWLGTTPESALVRMSADFKWAFQARHAYWNRAASRFAFAQAMRDVLTK